MGDVTFSVEAREARGKGGARKLRQRGMAPGIVYGGGRAATAIAFDVASFERLIETSHGGVNTLIDLAGDTPVSGRTVMARELQREPVRGGITHVDFFEIDMKEKLEVEVPIHLTGTPAGVVLGGVLDQQLREVLLMCLPGSIPDSIDVDVTGMELGDSLHLADLTVPEGCEFHAEATLTVATVLIPRVVKEDEVAEEGAEAAAETETAAEGAEEAKDDE
jgi:large subunit ribosomal protein L25